MTKEEGALFYRELDAWMREEQPQAVRDVYRHPDGTLRVFTYLEGNYLGLLEDVYPYGKPPKFPYAPPVPPELMARIPAGQ